MFGDEISYINPYLNDPVFNTYISRNNLARFDKIFTYKNYRHILQKDWLKNNNG